MTKPPTCWREMAGEAEQISVARSSTCAWWLRVGSRPARRTPRLGTPARRPAPDGAGERADGILRKTEDLADLAERRARAVGDDGRGKAGAVAAVFLVDVLHHLLAPFVLEIDVDVGRLVAFGRDEALEKKIGDVGIDLGDAEAKADGGIGGRAATLAEDASSTRAKRTKSWTVRK